MITRFKPELQSRSTMPASTELPGARKTIPPRVLGLSVAALAAATWGAFSSPDILAGYDALSWLLILIPVFLLAYYRGWQGTTRVLAGGGLFVLIAESAVALIFHVRVEWVFLFLVAIVLLTVGVGLGVLSELLRREHLRALTFAYSDPLTGLPNRRLLDFVLDKAYAAGQRGHPYAVVLFDVDGFKTYNTRYGDGAGDEALQLIATRLDGSTRRLNTTGRYYGDKFVSVLHGEKRDGAWVFAETAREAIADLTLPTNAKLTVSVSIAPYNPSGRDPEERLLAAAKGVSRAKGLGGNVSVYEGQS